MLQCCHVTIQHSAKALQGFEYPVPALFEVIIGMQAPDFMRLLHPSFWEWQAKAHKEWSILRKMLVALVHVHHRDLKRN